MEKETCNTNKNLKTNGDHKRFVINHDVLVQSVVILWTLCSNCDDPDSATKKTILKITMHSNNQIHSMANDQELLYNIL